MQPVALLVVTKLRLLEKYYSKEVNEKIAVVEWARAPVVRPMTNC